MIDSMSHSLLPLASWILFASLKSVVVIPLVLVIRKLSAPWLSQQGRYGLWLAVIACLSIPFGAQMRVGSEYPGTTPTPSQAAYQPATATAAAVQPIIRIAEAPIATASTLSTSSKAILVWLTGIAGLLVAVLHSANRYRRMKSRGFEVDEVTESLFKSCRQALNITRRIRILETSEIQSPVVVGYWRPALLLPLNLPSRISSEQLRLVLLHELSHIRRHDILANWLITFVQIAHWFNPLAWYALRIMRNDMEHACDASVLRRLSAHDKIEYGNTLIRLSDFTPQRTLLVQNASVLESRSHLKGRISMIAQFRSRGMVSTILAAALITLTCSLAVTQAADSPSQPPLPPLPRTSPTSQAATEFSTPPPSRPADKGKKVQTQTPAAGGKTANASRLEAVRLQITYAKAGDLLSFIKSAPGLGLLSEEGSIVVDDKTNALVVLDTAKNLATVRLLVEAMDVPVEKVYIETIIASVDGDLIRELTGVTPPGGGWSPTTTLEANQAISSLLEGWQKAGRAEIISRPVLVADNRTQASFEQGGGLSQLKLALTPTVRPDRKISVDFDVTTSTVGSMIAVPPDNRLVPSIDTRQLKTQLVLESGITVAVDIQERKDGRRLVAFVTPTLTPKRPPNSR